VRFRDSFIVEKAAETQKRRSNRVLRGSGFSAATSPFHNEREISPDATLQKQADFRPTLDE